MAAVSYADPGRTSWRRPSVPREALLCTGLATTAASLLVWLAPPAGDLAAHEYQRSLFLVHGFALWDNFWYAGRYAFVGYSVLYYPLAALLGIRLLAVLSVAVAAGAFSVLLEREWGATARWASRAFAVIWAGLPITGEDPFALGMTLALLALVAFRSGRPWIGAGLTLLVLAASPVALVLLAIVLIATAVARREPLRGRVVPALALGAAAAAELVLLRLFPFGGAQSFPTSSAAGALTFCVIGFACTRRVERARLLRFVFATYAITIVIAYVVPSGLGDNVERLRFLAVPLALLVLALRRWRPVKVSVAVLALALSWNVSPLAVGWARASHDISARAKVWLAPVAYLHAHLRTGYRVEAVDTTDHWPAYYLASAKIPLARGWFRQDDFPFDAILYRHRTLAPAQYLGWLRRLGVAYVVLTRSQPDYSSLAEKRLVRSGRSGLRRVFSSQEVSIYAVPHPRLIVSGPGEPAVVAFKESRLVVRVSRGGTYGLAVRWSPYWQASSGCLLPSRDGMVELRTHREATVRIAFDVNASSLLAALAGQSPRCRPGYETSRTSSESGLRSARADHSSAVWLAGVRARAG
ncbi:MAG TPA: hypothetical protein VFV91_12895 [Gaiellaceae bacterium]|jgi:hypothetical protein|nr:hypothetical protein [Gaiellaceae bacterium]